METIGKTFKNIRENRDLFLEDVKQKTGINKTLLSRIENGERLPTKEQVIQLSKFYNVEEDDLIVQWVSDKLVYEVKEEESALEAIQEAEEKVRYGLNRQNNREKQELKIENPVLKKSIEELKNKVIQGDCLDVMQSIPDQSMDITLCDLPYGTMENYWDSVTDLDQLWKQY